MPKKHVNKNKFCEGFTLIEMLVSLSIVVVIMSTVLFDYSTFSDNLALRSAGQELAVTIRQAQTYGLTVKEVNPAGGIFDKAYGVHFDKNDTTGYYLFVDSNGNKKYDAGAGCGSGPANTECIEKITLKNRIRSINICNAQQICPPDPSIMKLNITFLRPNPDAQIYFTNNAGDFVIYTPPAGSPGAKIVLSSPKTKLLLVTVDQTGQILVGPIQLN